MKSLLVAISMYSKLPVPIVEWDKDSLSNALLFFPVIGIVIGVILLIWWKLCLVLGFSFLVRGVVSLLIPIAVSGGVHMDGFCDTCDALSSHQPKERKLEILKDSHTGAFAIILCCLYLLVFFAFWGEAMPYGRAAIVLALGPVLSRSLSGLFAVTLPNARGTGLLATFTGPMQLKKARMVEGIWVAAVSVLMLIASPWLGFWSILGAACACAYYYRMSKKEFGGVTGDLAGFFLQICECAMVIAVVIGQRVGG